MFTIVHAWMISWKILPNHFTNKSVFLPILQVYLSEGLPGNGRPTNGISESFSVDAYLNGGGGQRGNKATSGIIPRMVAQVGLMSLATILPDADFLKQMIRSEPGNGTDET